MVKSLFSTVKIKNVVAGSMLAMAGLIAFTPAALAQQRSIKSGDWHDSGNWAGGTFPVATSNVTIKTGFTITVRSAINGGTTALAGTVILEPGAKLIIEDGAGMAVTSDISFQPTTTSNPSTIVDINGSLTLKSATASVLTTAGPNRYFRTSSTGKLVIEGVGGDQVLFPVGTTTYTPAYISNTGTVNTFSVSIADGVKDHTNTTVIKNVVNKTWNISNETNVGAVNATVRLQWNVVDETTDFKRNNSAVSHYNAAIGRWTNNQDFGLAEGSGPYTRSMTNVTSFSPFAVGDGNSPLPVELKSFVAVKRENATVLSWETASEKNNKGFEVQASADAKNFETVGSVSTKNGNANYTQRYEFTDKTSRSGLVYYRLKQTDLDGTVSYYAAKVVDMGRFASAVTAYPNPFNNQFTVSLQAASQLEVMDLTGKVIYTSQSEKGTVNVELNNQPAGMYLLKTTTNGSTTITRLVKQ